MNGLALGFGLGFFVALQLGPMSLYLIRSTLRHGLRVGLAIGAGIAIVDALYAAAGAAGAAPLVRIDGIRLVLGLLGAVVLVYLGARTLVAAIHLRAGLEEADEAAAPGRAFRTALGATASNPATIASWAAIFAAASTGTDSSPTLLVLGVALGSAAWVTTLACAVALARRSATARVVRIVDVVAGTGLLAFGAVLGYRTVTE
ncbi:MAG TPA: LysE family transporter [Mycobacteriales bacterium]|nr:LysE family transporter [Mycobacteriales bacterium]